jgi:diguanylate cyclase (GGDEF)-like protein
MVLDIVLKGCYKIMGTYKKSMKNQIWYLFILLMTTMIAVISSIAFYYWKISIDDMVMKIQEEAHANILTEIENFIQVPLSMNEENQYVIKHGLISMDDPARREMFFAGVMQAAAENVYSFSYGSKDGDYYGVRHNGKNELEFMKSNAETSRHSQYYEVKDDLTIGRVRFYLNEFDPRKRDWYQVAEKEKKPVFSSVYKHFIANDLAVSASYPIYDDQGILMGVLGTHVLLSKMNQELKDAVKDKQATAYIIERSSGDLVANTEDEPNFTIDAKENMQRIHIDQIKNNTIIHAFKKYMATSEPKFIDGIEEKNSYVKISEFKKDGLDWLIITAISEDPYVVQIKQSIFISILLSLVTVLIAILIWTQKIDHYLAPIYELIAVTESFSAGDFSQRANILKHDEVGKLGRAFNKMAEELTRFINDLEHKVQERTSELEERNRQLAFAKEQLEISSQTDFLTGLYNRKFIVEKIEQEIGRYKKTKEEFTLIMMDIDYFKKINDQFGHDCGDIVLKEVSQIIKDTIRTTDCIARWGGEEFLLFLPMTPIDGALLVAEKVRRKIEEHHFDCQSVCIKATMTLGIALYQEGLSLDEVVKQADVAVYNGKNNGRNQVYHFEKP